MDLLKRAASADGDILVTRTMGGLSITAGRESITERGNAKSEAAGMAAVRELEGRGLIERANVKGTLYRLTHDGFGAAENKTDNT
jgi:4-aminobutyrate aminotransferase-like enzyme